jgi:hypothetical protein
MPHPRLKGLEGILGPETAWPTFTDAQIGWLEKVFPARCMTRTETVEDHLRYAGAVDLISIMRSRVMDPNTPTATLDLTEEEAETLEMISRGGEIAHNQ